MSNTPIQRSPPPGVPDGGDRLDDYYTQPVGLGRPASLQAPLAGPVGNNS